MWVMGTSSKLNRQNIILWFSLNVTSEILCWFHPESRCLAAVNRSTRCLQNLISALPAFWKNTACLFKTFTGEVNLPWRTLTQLAGWTLRCIAGSGSGAWLWKNEAAPTLQNKAQHYNSSTDVNCNAPYRLQTSRPGRTFRFCCMFSTHLLTDVT